MLAIIKQFVRRMLMGKGAGIPKIPSQKNVDDFANDLLKKFKKNGVPDEAVTNTRDVKIIWEQITNKEAQIMHTNMMDIVRKGAEKFKTKKSADVLDLTGKKIDTSKPILGGKNVPKPKDIKTKLDKQNKESIQRFKDKMKKDPPEDLAEGGIAGMLGERTGYQRGGPPGGGDPGMTYTAPSGKWITKKQYPPSLRHPQLREEARKKREEAAFEAMWRGAPPSMGEREKMFRKHRTARLLEEKRISDFRKKIADREKLYPYADMTEEEFAEAHPKIYDFMKKDPNWNWETFQKVSFAKPGETFQATGARDIDLPLGATNTDFLDLFMTPFGKTNYEMSSEGPFNKTKIMSDQDKAQVALHEMRHKKILTEPLLTEAQPPLAADVSKLKQSGMIRDYPGAHMEMPLVYRHLNPPGSKEEFSPPLDMHEVFTRFMDRQYGHLKTSSGPYFDKIWRDEWQPYAKDYEKILTEYDLSPVNLAGGGLAPMLGEPTYEDGGRVPLRVGSRPHSLGQVLDIDWDDMDPDEWEGILKSVGAYQDGGRVPLKKGETPFKPPLPGENWMESWWKNLGPWEKLSVFGFGFEKGGRVGLWQGGLTAALRFLMQKYGKDVIKLAKDVKPSKKWDTQKAVQGFLERNPQFKNKITAHSGDVAKAGEGRFTKAEVLLKMFETTAKNTKSANTKKRFTNFSKEIQNKPELAKESDVWNFFTKGLPKNQKLVVYGDDTVDFWRQSKFGPHNIKTTDKFMKKHPYLTRDQAVKIQNMEPENQIFELRKIQAIRKRGGNAEGGIASLSNGGPLNTQALIELYMSEGMTHDEAVAAANASSNLPWNILTDKAEGGRVGMIWGGGVWKTIIQNLARAKGVTPSDYLKITNWKTLPKEVRNLMSKVDFEKMKQGRIEMFENWVEMAKTRMNFLKNIKEGKKTPAAPIFEHLEKSFKSPVPGKVSQKDILQGEYILKNLKTKGRKLHASGGVAGMLGE